MRSLLDSGSSPLDEEPQIDLTPLIDCLFMLIIFFVLTMSFSRPVMDLILPQSQSAQPLHADRQISIFVDARGQYFMNAKPVTLAQIEQSVIATPGALMNLHVDAKAPFDSFVPLVDLAKTKNNARFVISTQAASHE